MGNHISKEEAITLFEYTNFRRNMVPDTIIMMMIIRMENLDELRKALNDFKSVEEDMGMDLENSWEYQ